VCVWGGEQYEFSYYSVLMVIKGSFSVCNIHCMQSPVSARSKAWVRGLSLVGIVGSNPAGGMDVCLL
jgi:hypothetical protein